jgi:hypothetical protein
VLAVGACLGFWGFGGHCTTVVTAAISLFLGVIADVDAMMSASATLTERHGLFGTVATISDAPALSKSESCGGIETKPRDVLASLNRRAGENGRAACRLRLDEQLATDELETFPHAVQAQSQASTRRIDVKANAFITNGEMDGVAGSAKMDIELPDPAVPHRVMQRFLEYPEETERHVGRYAPRNVLMAEINLDVFLPRKLPRETLHCGHNAQIHQPWRMQLV